MCKTGIHLIIFLLFVTFAGCTSKGHAEEQASDAYKQGLKEGQSKGFEEGRTEGFKKGYNEGYDEGYEEGKENTNDGTEHGYSENTYPVTCPTCGGDGFIDGISNKEICPNCKMSGVIHVTERKYY